MSVDFTQCKNIYMGVLYLTIKKYNVGIKMKKITAIGIIVVVLLTSFTVVPAVGTKTIHDRTDTNNSELLLNNNFTISIKKPYGFLYVFGIPLVPLPSMNRFRAIIIGSINVEVEVEDDSVDKVEFYVDNSFKANDAEPPYEWLWNERLGVPPIHTLKVVGYAGNDTASDEICVLYVNPFLFRP